MMHISSYLRDLVDYQELRWAARLLFCLPVGALS
jgi:hypothetical protein